MFKYQAWTATISPILRPYSQSLRGDNGGVILERLSGACYSVAELVQESVFLSDAFDHSIDFSLVTFISRHGHAHLADGACCVSKMDTRL